MKFITGSQDWLRNNYRYYFFIIRKKTFMDNFPFASTCYTNGPFCALSI